MNTDRIVTLITEQAKWFYDLGKNDEKERIIKLLEKHEWFEKGEQDEILGILDGTYECNCGCLELIKGEQK